MHIGIVRYIGLLTKQTSLSGCMEKDCSFVGLCLELGYTCSNDIAFVSLYNCTIILLSYGQDIKYGHKYEMCDENKQ